MGQFRTSRTFDVAFLLVMALLLWWAVANRVAVGDWIYFLRYEPDTRTEAIAGSAGLNYHGHRLLYRTNPQFVSQAQVEAECDIEQLGCINTKGQVFILDDPGKTPQTIVTAAHEMLHFAYRRLSPDQKASLVPLLDQAVAARASELNPQLADEPTAEDRRDEAHSLLGTEYASLPPALEAYYATYFADRTKVLTAATQER